MEKIRPDVTIQEAVKEAQEDPEICDIVDPYERAQAIATWLDQEYPFAWMIKTRQDAAARAVGVPTQKELEREYRVIEETGSGWRTELERFGLSLIGVSGLFAVGDQWQASIGCLILGSAAIGFSKTLDKSE